MKTSELRAKTTAELTEQLGVVQKEQFELRMKRGVDKNILGHGLKSLRRTVARIKTILNEKVKGQSS